MPVVVFIDIAANVSGDPKTNLAVVLATTELLTNYLHTPSTIEHPLSYFIATSL